MLRFSSFQCLRLLMHTFNREYSQVSSSASESKVSPSLGPLTRPVNPSEPLAFTAKISKPRTSTTLCHFIQSLFNHPSSTDSCLSLIYFTLIPSNAFLTTP